MQPRGSDSTMADGRRPLRWVSRLAVGFACLLIVTCLAFGQGVTGRLVGTAQDQTQAAIPNAQVVITNQDTGLTWKYTTDSHGDYIVSYLPPGAYKVEVQASGFQNAVSSNNVVTVDQTTRVDFTMQVGKVAQSVEVKAVGPLVRSTTSDLGEVVDDRQVHELPLNGRIFSQLLVIAPGAVAQGWGNESESASGAGARSPITASVNGLPWQGTTYTLDGVNNMEPLNAFMNVTPPLEAIEEFKDQTSNPSADVGSFGGAQVNVYMKSGTNQFHGSVFEYLRNDALNARRWEANTKAPLKTNQFGGTLGGPIIKNRAFFFGDYQGTRIRNGQSFNITVPTQLMRQGIFSPSEGFSTIYDPQTGKPFPQLSNGSWQIPTSRFDSVAANMSGTNIWPLPNASGTVNNYRQNVSQKDSVNSFDVKGDYQFTNGDRLFVRESYQRRNLESPPPGTRFLFTWNVDSAPRDHNAAIGYTHSFSPTLLNEIRLGFNRFNTFHHGNSFGTNEDTALGIKNGNLAGFPETSGMANFWIGDIYQTGDPGWTNSLRLANVYEIRENLTWTKSRHTLKFGTDLKRVESTLTNPQGSPSGEFHFDESFTSSCTGQPNCTNPSGGDAFASFLLGLPFQINRGIVNTKPALRMFFGGVYGQDDYRVTKNLTLNLGLRWDVFTKPAERHNRQTNFSLADGLLHSATPDNRGPNVDTFTKGFGPRVGAAYSPDNGKTAIRAAFGISYFPDHFGATGGTLERDFPLFQDFTRNQQLPFTPFAKVGVDGVPGFVPSPVALTYVPPPNVNVYLVPRNFRQDMSEMWNLGVQRELTPTSALDVSYVGTKASHLYRARNINVPPPGPGAVDPRRPFFSLVPQISNVNLRASDGSSIYHSLQVKYTKRFSHGLQALVSYTWSKTIDNITIFDPFNDRLNRGLGTSSAPDIAHNFVASYIYELPVGRGRRWLASSSSPLERVVGGWSFSGISSIRDGFPLVMSVTGNSLNNTLDNRPDVTCSHVGKLGQPSASSFGIQWFDTSCFAPPQQFVRGNAGKGLVRGPGLVNFDLSLFKTEKVGEKRAIKFRADFFNAFNNPHFNNPATTLGNGDFGRISGTILTPREMQMGLEFTF